MDNAEHRLNHLSATSIEEFLMCGHKWYLHRVKKAPYPESWELIAGKAFHEAAAWALLNKAGNGENYPPISLGQHAVKHFNRFADEAPRIRVAPGEDANKIRAQMLRRTEMSAQIFANEILPKLDPAEGGIEKRLEIPAGQEYPKIICRLDLIDAHECIHDFKTGKKTKSDDEIRRADQLSAYGLAYRVNYGHNPKEYFFHFLVDKARFVGIIKNTLRNSGDMLVFLRKAQSVWRSHLHGIYLPASSGWWCSLKYCAYAGNECEYFKK